MSAAYGVTAVENRGRIPLVQRVVPSAGGLYPCHLYLVISRDTGGLETGVYYYDPMDNSLVQLRRRQGTKAVDDGGMGIIITAAYFNSAWKYRGRAYRYMLLDGGHLIQNLSLVLGALGTSHYIDRDAGDRDAGELLGLDRSMEAVLGCVAVGWNKGVSHALEGVKNATVSCSPELIGRRGESAYMEGFRELPAVHAACSTRRTGEQCPGMTVTEADPVAVMALPRGRSLIRGAGPESFRELEEMIFRRRSRRNFSREPMPRSLWQDLLSRIGADAGNMTEALSYRLLRLGMIGQNLEGLEDGFYLFSGDCNRLSLIRRGRVAPALGAACLDQAWISRAAVTFLFISDLDELERCYGPGGYRQMMITAGRAAQNIYLAAAALGLGCCGIGAIYDYEAKALLGLTDSSALVYAVSSGPVSGHGNRAAG
ncbi:MAG: SagB family peptide dehydrogenase [Desulfobacter sp.]|nr:MAG: SagB family peptide dehydrogenase [Desulfobacter sp.]